MLKKIFSDLSISKKITIIFLIVVSVCLVGTGTYTYLSIFENIELLLGQKLNHIARTAVLMIEAEDHLKIEEAMSNQDPEVAESAAFKKIQKTLQNIKLNNQLTEDIYTVIAPEWADGNMIFVTMSNEKSYVGNSIKTNPNVALALKTAKPTFSKIYSDSEGVWVSAFAPILDRSGKAIAVLEVDYHAEREVAEARLAIMKSIGLPAVLALLLCFIFGRLIGKALTKPISDLNHAAVQVSTGNLDVEIYNSSKDEIGTLARIFNLMVSDLKSAKIKLQNYATELEKKVEERTYKLAEAMKSNQTLLDNLGQGFMIINAQGLIQPGSTMAATHFFGTDPTLKLFAEILKLNSEEAQSVTDWIELAYANAVPFDSVAELGPRFFEAHNRYIELSYRPVFDEKNELNQIICIAEDKTKEKNLERKAYVEKQFTYFVINFVKDRDGFHQFIQNSLDQIKACSKQLDHIKNDEMIDFNELFRFFHTFKGEAACFHLLILVEKLHQIESFLSEAQAQSNQLSNSDIVSKLKFDCAQAERIIFNFMQENEELVGAEVETNYTIKKIDKDELEKTTQILQKNLSEQSEAYQAFVDTVLLEDLSDSFEKYKKLVNNLAVKQDKKIKMKIEKGKVRIRTAELQPLVSSCVHLFRNVVDHAIDLPEIRNLSNKPDEASVKLGFEEHFDPSLGKNLIRITLEDDGKGIDPCVIRSKLIEKNIKTEQELLNLTNEQIIQFVFTPQFSSREEVTELSGRGVGLDSITCEVKKLGGNVWVESELNKGSRFVIEIPHQKNLSIKKAA